MNWKVVISVFKKKSSFFVCIILIILITLVEFLGGFGSLDNLIYDFMLKSSPAPTEAPEVLFVDIDDSSLDAVGTWPWSRDILADTIIRMKELGAKSVIFDIEYLSPSQKGIHPEVIGTIPNKIASSESLIVESIVALSDAVNDGRLPVDSLAEVSREVIQDTIVPSLETISSSINGISRDNDEYFGQALQFFGNSWLTVNFSNIITTEESAKNYVKQRMLLTNVKDVHNYIEKDNDETIKNQQIQEGFAPALETMVKRAKGVGFTNVIVDEDGLRRRVELLYEKDGKYLGQLVFAPMLHLLQVESLTRNKASLTLHNALLPNATERKDIKIPLDRNGYMLINWIHNTYDKSFRHTSVLSSLYLDNYESQIIAFLRWLIDGDSYYLAADGSWLDYYVEASQLVAMYDEIAAYKTYLLDKCGGFDIEGNPLIGEISQEEYEEYFAARAVFFEGCTAFLNGNGYSQDRKSVV